MKSISLKIDDDIFGETEEIRTRIRKPRNRYINEAIEYYNQMQRRNLLKDKLAKESELVREDSMQVLMDFEDMDHED
jgi:predicted transcriptional regulator